LLEGQSYDIFDLWSLPSLETVCVLDARAQLLATYTYEGAGHVGSAQSNVYTGILSFNNLTKPPVTTLMCTYVINDFELSRTYGPCCMSVLHVHATCSCSMSWLYAHVVCSCLCCLSVLHVHAVWISCTNKLNERADRTVENVMGMDTDNDTYMDLDIVTDMDTDTVH
jgi:hypothetical protein